MMLLIEAEKTIGVWPFGKDILDLDDIDND